MTQRHALSLKHLPELRKYTECCRAYTNPTLRKGFRIKLYAVYNTDMPAINAYALAHNASVKTITSYYTIVTLYFKE